MIYKKFQIPCPLPDLGHSVGNLTVNDTAPVHMVVLPNGSERTGVNFMMDFTQREPTGLGESQARASSMEYKAQSERNCQPEYFVFNSRVRDSLAVWPLTFGSSCGDAGGCWRCWQAERVAALSFRQPTRFPSSRLPSCATPRSCPSTVNSKSKPAGSSLGARV